MLLGEFRDPLMILLEDARQAEIHLDANPSSQFARRAYIRSVFATIEGSIWLIKTACLSAKNTKGQKMYTPSEFALLREESYELKSNGEVKISPKFLKLPDNIKFIFKYISKRSGYDINIGVGAKTWEGFLQALEIRHRITHPKNTAAFNITDDEIATCRATTSWFNELIVNSINALFRLEGNLKMRVANKNTSSE
jgi:hypothetical protein